MDEERQKIICIWGKRKTLKINGGEVHGCPLRPRSKTGTIDLTDCKYCASNVGIIST